ncbi:hypothetical protein [Desertivirga arenae]|uniref:hypothetical protein n=1 Tax=Desertivirga arenae TaxID=2810309 RepID=UPI001A965E6A|nr:hypothetical protein [Pedobacter sp. SYSU D00823]
MGLLNRIFIRTNKSKSDPLTITGNYSTGSDIRHSKNITRRSRCFLPQLPFLGFNLNNVPEEYFHLFI